MVLALRKLCPEIRVWAVGGKALAEAGAEIIVRCDDIAAMGLVEIFSKLPAISKARKKVLKAFRDDPPDLFVPVDYGGFNLKMAASAKSLNIPVVYYIPPKVWAWGRGRVSKLRNAVDEALVILPFEEKFYRNHGVKASYVGSPVLDHLRPGKYEPKENIVTLLPGSRTGEVSRIMPLLAEAAAKLNRPDNLRSRSLKFIVPRAAGIPVELICGPAEKHNVQIEVIDGDAQRAMETARVVIAASGTASLECALVGAPMVVVYKLNPATYAIAKKLVRAPFISLPNLIMNRRIVPELIQTGPDEIAAAAAALLADGPERTTMLENLTLVKAAVGEKGASARAAQRIWAHLNKKL